MTRGETIFKWITDRHSEGMTAYATNYMHSIKIAPKHADRVRLSADGEHCEIMAGRRWDSINFCKITAR